MTQRPRAHGAARVISAFIRDFRWIHIGLGLLGNLSFFIGSIFFLWASWMRVGTWLFIGGSAGMLVGSIGSAIVNWEEQERQKDAEAAEAE